MHFLPFLNGPHVFVCTVSVLAGISVLSLLILVGAILAMSGQLAAIKNVFGGLTASVREGSAVIVAKIATLAKMCQEGGVVGLRYGIKTFFQI